MEPINDFLATHKNIEKIFSETWFESEIQKPDNEMHLLAKQFTFDNDFRDRTISYHLFDHLEENLHLLHDEIQRKGVISKKLRDALEYTNTTGQIEIAALFKKIGFTIELEPRLPESRKKSDILLTLGDFQLYIEVRTLHNREGKLVIRSGGMEISTLDDHPKTTLKEKIKDKTRQLSEQCPGILAIDLWDIPRTLHIEAAFYELSRDCPIISGVLLYRHFYNCEGCHLFVDFFANPFARLPIPESVEKLFEKGGICISTWPVEDVALVQKQEESQ